jgi:hypothetical protein
MKFIQQKHQLSDVAVSRIDWTSHAQVIRNFQTSNIVYNFATLISKEKMHTYTHYYNMCGNPTRDGQTCFQRFVCHESACGHPRQPREETSTTSFLKEDDVVGFGCDGGKG